jgi:hypothetical protein
MLLNSNLNLSERLRTVLFLLVIIFLLVSKVCSESAVVFSHHVELYAYFVLGIQGSRSAFHILEQLPLGHVSLNSTLFSLSYCGYAQFAYSARSQENLGLIFSLLVLRSASSLHSQPMIINHRSLVFRLMV